MVEIELNNKKVAKIKFHLTGENGEFLWIAFELEDGTKEETMYMKGIESIIRHQVGCSYKSRTKLVAKNK